MAKTKEEYQKIIDSAKDPANLSEQDLQNLIEAYQGSGGKTQVNSLPPDQLLNLIYNSVVPKLNFGSENAKQKFKDRLAQEIPYYTDNTDQTIRNLPWQGEATSLLDSTEHGALISSLGDINSQIGSSRTTIDPNAYKNEIAIAQGLLKARGNAFSGDADAKISEFFNTAPKQLDAERQSFYDAQRNQAKDYITGEYAPQVAERLASRGLGDSGQVGASVGSKYSNLLQGIDASQTDQMNEDATYFSNQAYNKTFNDLITARGDVAGTIKNANENLRTNQANSFSKSQANLEAQFNLDLFKQQSASAFNTYQNQVYKERQQSKDKAQADTIGQLGQAGVTIGAAALL